MSHVDSRVKEISLDTFASGLSEQPLIVSGFGYPEWKEKDVELPDAAVKYGYRAVIAMVNSNKSCEEAWQRSVEANEIDRSIPVQDRLNPENYTETDDERAAALLNLSNVRFVFVHDAPGSWPVIAALYEAVKRYHPDYDIAYRAKKPYANSRGKQTAEQLGMKIFSGPINESRTPVPQDSLPETPEFEFSESCRIYVPSR